MLLIRKPTPEMIRAFLEQQRNLAFSYREVGRSASVPPAGYTTDHTRVMLGEGYETFTAACRALRHWQHFRLGWIDAWPADTPLQEGQVVAVLARCTCTWWLNACRIIYVIDDEHRFGFAYGTLPDHVASGEERFLVEMDQAGIVWYDILAFSRPRHILARLGYLFMRQVQRRFAADSASAMRTALRTESESDEDQTTIS